MRNTSGSLTAQHFGFIDNTSSLGQEDFNKVTFDYDPAGRLLIKTDQLGDSATYNYDLVGRLEQRDYRTAIDSPAGPIADSDVFTYDNLGRILTATSGRYLNLVTMAYNDAGRLKDETLRISNVDYTVGLEYNSRGQLWKMTYPDNSVVERTYTDRGQLFEVKLDGTIESTNAYDGAGRRLNCHLCKWNGFDVQLPRWRCAQQRWQHSSRRWRLSTTGRRSR